MTRQERVKKNSIFLNLVAILVIMALVYFLYCIYLERQMVFEYLNLVKVNTWEPGPEPFELRF